MTRDPKPDYYKLWVDIYGLVACDVAPKGDPIEIEASIGSSTKMGGAPLVYKPKTKSWKFKPVKIPTLAELCFPQDLSQIPDIFINLYTKGGRKEGTRLAYLRLKARDCMSSKPKPTWYRLRSPYTDTGSTSIGLLQANV